jgi:single-strand DNA-binding protein
MARNVAGSLVKGDGVTVVGRLNVSTWTAQDGSERTNLEIEAISVGHDLRHGTTRLARNERPQRDEAPGAVTPEPGDAASAIADWEDASSAA